MPKWKPIEDTIGMTICILVILLLTYDNPWWLALLAFAVIWI